MTEEQWLSSSDPAAMLQFLQGSERKLRLFACACVRRIWYLLLDERLRRAIEAAERHADGDISDRELGAAVSAAHRARRRLDHAWRAAYDAARYQPGTASGNATSAVQYVPSAVADATVSSVPPTAITYFQGDRLVTEEIPMNPLRAAYNAAIAGEHAAQASVLRDIFGPLPFRPVTVNPGWAAWNDGTVRRLAEAIYEERSRPEGLLDTTRIGVLADALEDAGCADVTLLEHLRGPGPHVRGCWVVDLL